MVIQVGTVLNKLRSLLRREGFRTPGYIFSRGWDKLENVWWEKKSQLLDIQDLKKVINNKELKATLRVRAARMLVAKCANDHEDELELVEVDEMFLRLVKGDERELSLISAKWFSLKKRPEVAVEIWSILIRSSPELLSKRDFLLASKDFSRCQMYKKAISSLEMAEQQFLGRCDFSVEKKHLSYKHAEWWQRLTNHANIPAEKAKDFLGYPLSWEEISEKYKGALMGVRGVERPALPNTHRPVIAGLFCVENCIHDRPKAQLELAELLGNVCPFIEEETLMLADYILSYREGKLSSGKVTEDLVRFLSSCEVQIREGNPWLSLYTIFIWNGLIKLGALVREMAIKRTFSLVDHSFIENRHLMDAAKAALDRCNITQATLYLSKVKGGARTTDRVQRLMSYAKLLSGDLKSYQEPYRGTPFYDYIKDKSVAIVGPAPGEGRNGADIDAFDVVVRLNSFGAPPKNKDRFGGKTSVSYLTMEILAKKKCLGDSLCIVGDLDYLVLREGHHRQMLSLGDGISIPRFRTLPRDMFFWNLYPNGVQRVLLDLFRFNPSQIKVFNTNFFITKELWSKDHASGLRTPSEKQYSIIHDLSLFHDILAQFDFVKSLYDIGLIEVDQELTEILQMSSFEYAAEIERIHGAELVFKDKE